MNTPTKFAVLSGRRMDQGKTSIVDNLIAPRLEAPVRIEIDLASTGSAKPGVMRIQANQLQTLRSALFALKRSQSLVCDVGGSEYASFMSQIAQNYASTTAEFHRFVFVMRAGGIKQADALESITELLAFGTDPAKVRVLFNFAPWTVGLDNLRRNLRMQFPIVFEAAEKFGFQVCDTPIVQADPLYQAVFSSPEWDINSLAAAPSFREQIMELTEADKLVPEKLYLLESAQANAQSFGKPNLDAVWAEILAVKKSEGK